MLGLLEEMELCSGAAGPTHKNTRHKQHHTTHDKNNAIDDHVENHPPHLTTIKGGAATVRTVI